MDLEDVDRPGVKLVCEALARSPIVVVEAATTEAGVSVAEAAIGEMSSGGASGVSVFTPRIAEPWVVEEVAAAIILELGVPIAPREDEAGLSDAVADALRHAAVPFVMLTEPEWFLRHGGAEHLVSWTEETSTRFILIATGQGRLAIPPEAVRVRVATRSETGLAEMLERRWDSLDALETAIVSSLGSCPVALPASELAAVVDSDDISSALDALARDGIARCTWTAGEMFVGLTADAYAVFRRRDQPALEDRAWRAREDRCIEALLGGATDAMEMGELKRFRDAELLGRRRAALRCSLFRALSSPKPSAHVGRLTLLTMSAMESLGPLSDLCLLAMRGRDAATDHATRARLDERTARLLRALGRFQEAEQCLERAAAHAGALPPRAVARLAYSLARMALPERDGARFAEHAERLAATLPRDDALVRGLAAMARSAIAWNRSSADEAISPLLQAIVHFGDAGFEPLQVAALGTLVITYLGAERTREAVALARQLTVEVARIGHGVMQASGAQHYACAALQAGDHLEAIRHATSAIDRFNALGYRHAERWARAHRGLALLAVGRHDDAARDFDDFMAMTRVVGGSDLVGTIGGALAGSVAAAEALVSLPADDVPPYFREIVRTLRVLLGEAPAEKIYLHENPDQPPGYFAFEVRHLKAAVLRATAAAPRSSGASRLREMLVARDGSWVEIEGEPRVSLGRTRTLRRVLLGLVVAHARDKVLDLEDVYLLGWPEEKATPASRANRVHVTLSRLRAAGLGATLQFSPGGWRLDPGLRILRI